MNLANHTRLKIVHIITQLELGGAQRNTLYTVGHLDPGDFEAVLVSGPGGILDPEAAAGLWPTHFIPWLGRPIRPWKDVMALLSLYKLLRRLKPHIVHTHSSKAGILGRIAAYVAGVPVVIHTFHGFGFTPVQRPFVRRVLIGIEYLCGWLSTHLIFVSKDNEAEAHALGIALSKPRSLIRSGIPIGESSLETSLRKELDIPLNAWVVTSVGNFKPQKNPMDVARTAKVVLAQDPNVKFLIVGDGELRASVEAFIQSEGLETQVRLLGWRQDIPAILSASDCFLLTSLWEGLPRALVEAAIAELPGVAYAVNGVKDILIEGDTGYPIPPHDIQRAAEKILWLKNNPEEAMRMGKRARRQAEKEFDIRTMVRSQEDLYKALYEAVPLKDYYEPFWNLPKDP